MPELRVTRSLRIAAPREVVFAVLADLSRWRPWNPWLVMEPEAWVEIEEGGKSCLWRGTRTGQGRLRLVRETRPRTLECVLEFQRPYHTRAEARFELSDAVHGGTEVRWSLRATCSVLFFFLARPLEARLGQDGERGLRMLKDFVELGSVPSRLEYLGESEFPECDYIGVTRKCAIGELMEWVQTDFQRLDKYRFDEGLDVSGRALHIYREWRPDVGFVRYSIGFPVVRVPVSLPAGFERGSLPALRTFVIDHLGSHRHLGNAWSAAAELRRANVFVPAFDVPAFEIHTDIEREMPELERRVLVHFPVRR